jgi:hypothetical protein
MKTFTPVLGEEARANKNVAEMQALIMQQL